MMSEPTQFGPEDMKVIGIFEEDAETSEWVTRMEEEAEADIAARRIVLDWAPEQVDVVKRAAAIVGVPYGSYLKQVVFRQALEDIERAEAERRSRPAAS